LPIYDKADDLLSTFNAEVGNQGILIITTAQDNANFVRLLGDGIGWGLEP